MRIVFFQNIVSPHQAAFLQALASHAGLDVRLAVETEEDCNRTALGWTLPEVRGVDVVRMENPDHACRLVHDGRIDQLLVFSGTGAYPLVRRAMLEAVRLDRRFGIIAEPPKGLGVTGLAREFREATRARRLRGNVRLFLAVGREGYDRYLAAGYPANVLFRWGYFVEPEERRDEFGDVEKALRGGPLRFVFSGQLIRRKGIDILAEAIQQGVPGCWSLDVIGSGPFRDRLAGLCPGQLGTEVRCHGALPRTLSLAKMAGADVLLLPSRWDGWGLVVNEALLRGLRVICTERCGAAELIRTPADGTVIRAESVSALREAMTSAVAKGMQTQSEREATRRRSAGILPGAAAKYFADIVRWTARESADPRPAPPWLVDSTSAGKVLS